MLRMASIFCPPRLTTSYVEDIVMSGFTAPIMKAHKQRYTLR